MPTDQPGPAATREPGTSAFGWTSGKKRSKGPTVSLPDLRAGIYRHYKGPLYLVLGYAHDANENERNVVVYVGLELTGAHRGPRMAVRTAEDFLALVHTKDGTICDGHNGEGCYGSVAQRFHYVGPEVMPK